MKGLTDSLSPINLGQFMRERPGFWTDLTVNLSAQEIVALIKALTVTERDVPQMNAGSVSPVIWLYRHLRQRFPGEYTELEKWILQHTNNDYLPWGTSNHGARSLDEYRRLSEQVQQRREERRTAEEKRQAESQERKAWKATQDLFGAIKRRDDEAILGLRRKGADVNATDGFGKSVLELARDTGNPNVIAAVTCVIAVE